MNSEKNTDKTKDKKKSAKPIPKSTRFEDAMSDLEKIVQSLEEGDQPLDKSLEQFERGITLARFCQQSLTEADHKIKILLGDNENDALSEFDDPS